MQTCKVKMSSTKVGFKSQSTYFIVPTQNFSKYCYKSQLDKHVQH